MRRFGLNAMPQEKSGSKPNLNGRLSNAATNSCQLKKSLPRKDLNQKCRGESSSKAPRPRERGQTREELGSVTPFAVVWISNRGREVGRIVSGAFEPIQKRGPKFRAPKSGYNLRQCPG